MLSSSYYKEKEDISQERAFAFPAILFAIFIHPYGTIPKLQHLHTKRKEKPAGPAF